ncbi:hypothetical protein ILUMI_03468 [Ignelater luminosus]|uniref:PiggyBac transposable element-derived protein domain-containing protein n=1 Tax=Ignelater luminosus TaxID=2038154 RepID=A0A8K0GKF2_IGNLU|nr:hypothetical protein ILUMI_03468 [Ignelater luminosus]
MSSKELRFRNRVYKFYEENSALGKLYTCKHFSYENVSKSTIYNIIQRFEKGSTVDRRNGSGCKAVKIPPPKPRQIENLFENYDSISLRTTPKKHDTMSRPLTGEELLQLIEEGLSDIDCLSHDDDDGWESNAYDAIVQTYVDQLEEERVEEVVLHLVIENPIESEPNTYATRKRRGLQQGGVQIPQSPVSRKQKGKTNLYAVQNNITHFTPTMVHEIKVFIGIHIVMGCLGYPMIKCYWEPKLRIDVIANNMNLNSFYYLRQAFHLADVTQSPNQVNRFWKVRFFYNQIRPRCMKLPTEPAISIDKQMVPFKGQHNVKQYIRGKPSPWGTKIFALCGTSG